MDLNFVKQYLRVDYEDDDAYITLLLDAAKKYVENAVGYCDIENPLVKVLLLSIIAQMYENREFSISDEDKKSYLIKSIIMQLQLSDPPIGGADNG